MRGDIELVDILCSVVKSEELLKSSAKRGLSEEGVISNGQQHLTTDALLSSPLLSHS